jgi:hypothetical protein
MAVTTPVVSATQKAAANCQGKGALFNSMKTAITRITLKAEMSKTTIVEESGDTVGVVTPNTEVTVPNTRIAHVSRAVWVDLSMTYFTKYKRGNKQIQMMSTICQYVAPLS